MRQIDIDGEKWEFQVGKSHVKLRAPDGKGHVVSIERVLGRSLSEIDHARYAGYLDCLDGHNNEAPGDPDGGGSVTPKHIRAVILDLKANRGFWYFLVSSDHLKEGWWMFNTDALRISIGSAPRCEPVLPDSQVALTYHISLNDSPLFESKQEFVSLWQAKMYALAEVRRILSSEVAMVDGARREGPPSISELVNLSGDVIDFVRKHHENQADVAYVLAQALGMILAAERAPDGAVEKLITHVRQTCERCKKIMVEGK